MPESPEEETKLLQATGSVAGRPTPSKHNLQVDLGPFAKLQKEQRDEEKRRTLNPDLKQLESMTTKAADLNAAIAKRASELGLPVGRLGTADHLISPTQLESQVKHELLKQYSAHLKMKAEMARRKQQEDLKKWNQDRADKLKEARARSKVKQFIDTIFDERLATGEPKHGARAQHQSRK